MQFTASVETTTGFCRRLAYTYNKQVVKVSPPYTLCMVRCSAKHAYLTRGQLKTSVARCAVVRGRGEGLPLSAPRPTRAGSTPPRPPFHRHYSTRRHVPQRGCHPSRNPGTGSYRVSGIYAFRRRIVAFCTRVCAIGAVLFVMRWPVVGEFMGCAKCWRL